MTHVLLHWRANISIVSLKIPKNRVPGIIQACALTCSLTDLTLARLVYWARLGHKWREWQSQWSTNSSPCLRVHACQYWHQRKHAYYLLNIQAAILVPKEWRRPFLSFWHNREEKNEVCCFTLLTTSSLEKLEATLTDVVRKAVINCSVSYENTRHTFSWHKAARTLCC